MLNQNLSAEDRAIIRISSEISDIFEAILADKGPASLLTLGQRINIDIENLLKDFQGALAYEAKTVPPFSCSHPLRVARALKALNDSTGDLEKLENFKNEIEQTEFDTFLAKNLAQALLAAFCIVAIFTVFASVAVGTAGGGFCFGLPVFLSLTAFVSCLTLPIAYVDWDDKKQTVDKVKTYGTALLGFFDKKDTTQASSVAVSETIPASSSVHA